MRNLNESQFREAVNMEEQQRRRFRRKHESGFVGNGFWWTGYPYVVGTLGTGGMTTAGEGNAEQQTADATGDSAGAEGVMG